MEIAQVVGFGVIAAVIIIFIRQSRPDIAQLLSIAVGVVIVIYLLGYLNLVVNIITDLALEAEINTVFLRTLLRVIGVAYIAEFGAQVCRDAGEGSIAMKIEFAGKLIILVMAIPILIAVLEGIVNFIPDDKDEVVGRHVEKVMGGENRPGAFSGAFTLRNTSHDAAAQEETELQEVSPGAKGGGSISSLEGWEEVESYWRELETEMGEFLPRWDIGDIWERDEGGIIPGIGEILKGLIRYLFREIVTNFGLLGQLILLAVAAALLKSLQGSFSSEEVARLTEAVAFFVLLGLALKSFTVALEIGRNTVDSMVNFMLALLPVLLTLLASMGHVTSAGLFHPFIIFSVNLMASLVRNILFPLIFFATILYMVNHFSPHFKINRLADLFKDISTWGLGLMLTLFVGLLTIQGVAGGIGDALTLRTAKYMTGAFIPVVGKMLADAVETVLGYSLLLKNSATIAGLLILSLIVAFPLIKLLALIIIYKFSGAVLQPLGETTLGEALHTMGNCLVLVFAAVATVSLAFFIGIAIIVGASNAAVMLR